MSEYIAGVQLSREQIRAKNKETLMELINNGQIPDTEKQAAIQSMIRMTEISEKENAAETLLRAKGFVDPVVSITEDQVDVVVNAVTLTDPERAQIEDIVKRKTEVGANGIVITLMDLAEVRRSLVCAPQKSSGKAYAKFCGYGIMSGNRHYTIAHLVSAFTAEIQAPNSPRGTMPEGHGIMSGGHGRKTMIAGGNHCGSGYSKNQS